MKSQLALDRPVCQRLDATHSLVPLSSLAATGVMTTTFITVSDTSGTEGKKHSVAGRIKEHNELKTAACNQSGCKMCKRTFHKGKKVSER